MPNRPHPGRRLDAVVILGLLGLFLFASPLVDWWSQEGRPWYLPFVLWVLLIGAGIGVQRFRARHKP